MDGAQCQAGVSRTVTVTSPAHEYMLLSGAARGMAFCCTEELASGFRHMPQTPRRKKETSWLARR